MRERIIDAIKVILMLGLSTLTITFLYKLEGKAPAPDKTLQVMQDTIPKFYSQPAKEGLWEALVYYDLYHPEIVYAQAQLETGYFKSQVCLKDNNLFGLYDSKNAGYYKFDHWSESIVAYKNWIQRGYKPPNNYYSFLERIHYASDSLYTWKLKQIVKQNEKRRSIGVCSSDSLSLHAPSISDRIR